MVSIWSAGGTFSEDAGSQPISLSLVSPAKPIAFQLWSLTLPGRSIAALSAADAAPSARPLAKRAADRVSAARREIRESVKASTARMTCLPTVIRRIRLGQTRQACSKSQASGALAQGKVVFENARRCAWSPACTAAHQDAQDLSAAEDYLSATLHPAGLTAYSAIAPAVVRHTPGAAAILSTTSSSSAMRCGAPVSHGWMCSPNT